MLMIGIRQFFTVVKIFPILIRQNFPPSKFCAIRYTVHPLWLGVHFGSHKMMKKGISGPIYMIANIS